jgi:hypothetical protein
MHEGCLRKVSEEAEECSFSFAGRSGPRKKIFLPVREEPTLGRCFSAALEEPSSPDPNL